MDGKRFDELTRGLASHQSRRSLLKGLLGLTGAAVVTTLAHDQTLARRSSGGETSTTSPPCPGQVICGTFCCDEDHCNQYQNGCCPRGTTACADNSTGCCAVCGGERPARCGYECCVSPELCCGGECCNIGDVCIAEETCCTPYCAPGSCGGDGCGGTCECGGSLTCCYGTCTDLNSEQFCGSCDTSCAGYESCGGGGIAQMCGCTPDCDGTTCGSDNCGDACSCPTELVCDNALCIPITTTTVAPGTTTTAGPTTTTTLAPGTTTTAGPTTTTTLAPGTTTTAYPGTTTTAGPTTTTTDTPDTCNGLCGYDNRPPCCEQGVCVWWGTDQHCFECNDACTPPMTCGGGEISNICGTTEPNCGGVCGKDGNPPCCQTDHCVELGTDAHCASCDDVCSAPETCGGGGTPGVCGEGCGGLCGQNGNLPCCIDGHCYDIGYDDRCSSCDDVCVYPAKCTYVDGAPGCHSSDNCEYGRCGGTCGCPKDYPCCNHGSCIQLGNNLNCGACGVSCDDTQVCKDGQCTCGPQFYENSNGVCERIQDNCQYQLKPYGDLQGCDLTGYQTGLAGMDLTGANLTSANMSAISLAGTWLQGATFISTNMQNTQGPNAIFGGALFQQANLSGANFHDADFPGALLASSDLTGANLERVNFYLANLSGSDLTGADLLAVEWQDTICPDGVNSNTESPQTCCGHLNGKIPAAGCPESTTTTPEPTCLEEEFPCNRFGGKPCCSGLTCLRESIHSPYFCVA